jgi:hypothetical protein
MIASIAERVIACSRASPSRSSRAAFGRDRCRSSRANAAVLRASAPVTHGASRANSVPVPSRASARGAQMLAAAATSAAAAMPKRKGRRSRTVIRWAWGRAEGYRARGVAAGGAV